MAGGGYLDAGQQIFLAVGTQDADGQLRAGQDDGLVQVFEHEAQCRSRVGHRIGAVQDDEARVLVVVVANDTHQSLPRLGIHVRRIHWRVELICVNAETEVLQLGNVLLELLHVEVFQCTCLGVFYHSDSTAGVY